MYADKRRDGWILVRVPTAIATLGKNFGSNFGDNSVDNLGTSEEQPVDNSENNLWITLLITFGQSSDALEDNAGITCG